MQKHIFNAWIMFKRCFLISLRNPEALLMATITPFFLMLLFGTVFGSIVVSVIIASVFGSVASEIFLA